jgi:hypothetical protein
MMSFPVRGSLAVADDDNDQNKKIPRSWNALLAQIRKRPAMYFGSLSLQGFHQFLGGFSLAELVYGISEERRMEVEDFAWEAFETYVATLHNELRLSLNSFGLAQFEAQGKDIKTFDAWKEHPGAWKIWWRWHDDFVKATASSNGNLGL